MGSPVQQGRDSSLSRAFTGDSTDLHSGGHCGLKKLKPLVNITQLMTPSTLLAFTEVDQGRFLFQGVGRWGSCQTISVSAVSPPKGQPWPTALTFGVAPMSVSSPACPARAAQLPLLQHRERGQWLLSYAFFAFA